MRKILVVGQTPPPYGGQALMTRRLVEAKFDSVQILHVRMAFSETFLEVGKASAKKLWHLLHVAWQIWKHRISNRKLTLYYMPAGPNAVPIIRDLVLLALVRPLFRNTIYHFRAAGVSEYIQSRSPFFRCACKLIYGRPTIGIQLSSLNPKDAAYFSARTICYVPNGIEDIGSEYLAIPGAVPSKSVAGTKKILFVGVLREDKGFSWLLNALQLLISRSVSDFQLLVIGEFASKSYQQYVMAMIGDSKLSDHVVFLGVKTGTDKWQYFEQADFLCFPTFFECESFGNVLIEAMMFGLPVIASQWRGIPEIVDEKIGLLVPVKDEELLAAAILKLLQDGALRQKLGQNGRKKYLEKYTLSRFLNQMEKVFQLVD